MKHFFTALVLRAYDLIWAAGGPPYSYAVDTPTDREIRTSYSLAKAIASATPDPATVFLGTRQCQYPIYIGFTEVRIAQDRLGRKHLPAELRRRLF